MNDEEAKPYAQLLADLREDASYSAQAYFEAAKAAEIWGRAIVFVPAVLGSIAAMTVALGGAREWGAVGAVAAAVAATASFLGSSKNAASFKESARRFTNLRHRAATELALVARRSSEGELEEVVRELRSEYAAVVQTGEPVPALAFAKARRRIKRGLLNYESNRT